ncbi:hypothetical protein AQUCO_01000716v1 [Aquilegia coerulea]|uniref:Uncharacterized protein n=1 Tax=Aquilegia coerulea TaxID=218851 RepID=A0A2G5EB91_AQUCA|nr:hypothetical protein AQUCO_01000716v1 [Aquilegia coerulea]
MYSKSELEASAANKEGFFARKIAENESKPEGLPPSQGGKYVGFGSTPPPTAQRNTSQGGIALKDTVSVVSQGLGRLSLVAVSAAQSAANVVQAGTKELTTKVKEGGYDHKVNETVNVVTTKTTEIGQRTWGLMKGVMALASQKVEEYNKEGVAWKGDNWQGNGGEKNGYNQDFAQGSKGYNSSTDVGHSVSGRQFKSVRSSNSWDDWDNKDNNGKGDSGKQGVHDEDGWAGWNEAKDDGYESFQHSSTKKSATGQTGKSDDLWSEGGFL